MVDGGNGAPAGGSPRCSHPDIGVLAYVPEAWSRLWQPRHHVLSRLARRFPVVWIEPSHEWREIPRRLRERLTASGSDTPPGLVRCTPPWWLPNVYRPAPVADRVRQLRSARALRILERQGVDRVVLYLWRPQFADALDAVPHDLSVYHIDDEYSFTEHDAPTSESERRVIRRSDMVFVHSPGLMEKKGRINPHTHYVPNGVDFGLYSHWYPEPEDLRSVPHPRVGYTGYLKRELDWPLLLHLAERHPDWQIVLVGEVKEEHPEIHPHVEEMRRRENVHLLGSKTMEELAEYPCHFDVSLMPYRRTAYTDYIYPLKLHEYLAAGPPVVASPIRTLRMFEHVVRLADDPETWSRQIAAALDEADVASARGREARRAVARRHDWDRLADLVAGRLLLGLGREAEADAVLPNDAPRLGEPEPAGDAV